MPQHLLTCLELYNCLQKERGLTALYLNSDGQRGFEKLLNQYLLTDTASRRLAEETNDSNPHNVLLKESIQNLPVLREQIVGISTDAVENARHYTEKLVLPTLELAGNYLLHDARFNPVKASAFLHLLEWHKWLCLEREEGTRLSLKKIFGRENILSIAKMASRQRDYGRLFFGTADENQKHTFASVKNARALDNMDDKINDAIISGITTGTELQSFVPLDWFTIFDAKASMLYSAAKALTMHLFDAEQSRVAVATSGGLLDNEVENHFLVIRSLPLFTGLSSAALRDVLGAARIAHHEKGSLFLIQGEAVTKFQIVLEGWAKVFKSTADGEESILHVIGKKECLLDADPLRAGVCPVSAKAVTKIKLLSFPASVMSNHLGNYKELAVNAFTAATQRNQKLIGQFEQLTLRTAEQRVGWFLLNLHLNAGASGEPINLPFDKALIAAYLNIKPETFSRILQGLKKKGFEIERQKIVMPSPSALCEYCDQDMALRCCRVDRGDCRVGKR